MEKEQLSRRQFLKGTAAAALSAAFVGLTGCGNESSAEAATEAAASEASAPAAALFTPGTYTASARGISSDVTVTMTFSEDKITDVVVDVSGETETIGALIGDEVQQQILDAQSAEIDGVSGATTSSTAVRKAAAECIAQATGIPVAEEEEASDSADWLGEEPVIDEASITETIDCEVLVVGAGNAGAFAAAAAVEAGAKTILIERYDHDGASGIRDTFAACGSTEQQEDGADVPKATAVNYLSNWSQGYTRRSLAQLWADNSGELVDWYAKRLEEGGMSFRHEIDGDHPSNYQYLEVGHSVQYGEEYYEQLTMDKVFDYAVPLGLDIHYEVTMLKLEKNADGRVTGVLASKADGSIVRYNASNGVIMATGGYSNNMDMIKALQPWTIEQIGVNYSKAGSKGDGIKACLWAGAKMDTVHSAMIFDRACIKPDEVGKTGESVPAGWFWMGSQPFLKVNLDGERFMNEYQPYDYVLHQAAVQPNHTYCTVWDSTYAEDIERFGTHGCSRLYPHENGTDPVFPMAYVDEMNAGLMEEGYIVQADTIEELAEKLNIPVDTFKATVERYNELSKIGEDEDFGKEDYRLSTLDTAPFYGTRQCGGYFICTMDGIQIDDTLHAMSTEGEAIPGLYVVGDCSGNYFAGSYPNLMSGAAAGRSATFGRLAGQFAAKGIDL